MKNAFRTRAGKFGVAAITLVFAAGMCLFPFSQHPIVAKAATFVSASTVNYPAGGNSAAFASCDFNGDGIPDFAVANQTSPGKIDVLLSNSVSHTYNAAVEYDAGSNFMNSITCGSYNSTTDSSPDIAAGSSSLNQLSVLLNNGDGTFGTATVTTPTTFNVPQALITLDFNNDGKKDLAATDYGSNEVSLLQGNGDGTFTELTALSVGSQPLTAESITSADFNGDGNADLAVTNTSDNTISVLLGNNDGTFPTVHTYSTGTTAPVGIVSADLGNGEQDLIVASDGSNQVTVFKGVGDGTFLSPTSYAASNGTSSVTVADFDGDGHPDVAVTNPSSGSAEVMLFPGDGTGALAATPVGFNPSPGHTLTEVLNGNYTGDGNHDLAVLNSFGSDMVSIVPNTPPGPLDHFLVSSSNQIQGDSFNVTITAEGPTNLTRDEFFGTVDLSTNVGSISPTTSGSFVNGVLTLSVSITGGGLGQTITATDHAGSGKFGTSAPFNMYPSSEILNASAVLGQTDYVTGTAASPPTAASMSSPTYTALDTVNHRLFVADETNARVLVYPLDANNNFTTTTASYIFGQTTVSGHTAAVGTQNGLGSTIYGLAYDSTDQRLFVADGSNNRVMIYDATPATLTANGNGENATYILGQTNFTLHGTATTQNGLSNPRGLAYDDADQRLFVGDSTNNRVMVFDVSNATLAAQATGLGTAENATYVLGQANFTTATAHTTQNGLSNSVVDGTYDSVNNRLFVVDPPNNRIMIFDTSSATLAASATGSGTAENASYVIGQVNFTSSVSASTQSGLRTPRGATYDTVNDRLFVADTVNNRIMIYDVSPANLALANPGFGTALSAENVIGQIDFISTLAATKQYRFDNTGGPVYDPLNNTLYVSDTLNNRVLEYYFVHITTASLPGGTVGTTYTPTTIATTAAAGQSQSFAVASGALPAGLTLNTSTGAITGTPTAAGTSSVTIEADDNFLTGAYYDRATYSIVIAASSGGGGTTGGGTTGGTTGGGTTGGGSSSGDSGHGGGVVPPFLEEKNPIAANGSYTFTSNESGSLYYGDGCISTTMYAVNGDNTVVLSGTGAGCTIELTDTSGRTSNVLSVTSSSGSIPAPLSSVPPVSSPTTVAAVTTLPAAPPVSLPQTDSTDDNSIMRFIFTASLNFGMHDFQVFELQRYLNSHGTPLASSGPGSVGNETVFFGPLTRAALMEFQEQHAADILVPLGLTEGTGLFRILTRTYVNGH